MTRREKSALAHNQGGAARRYAHIAALRSQIDMTCPAVKSIVCAVGSSSGRLNYGVPWEGHLEDLPPPVS
jgi:hypothetical protein